MRLTPARRRALEIVYDHPGIGPSAFAKLMWPDSKGHTTRSRRHATPAGGAVGAGIKMSAGAFLGRLRTSALLRVEFGRFGSTSYWLSELGLRALQEPD